MGVQCERNNLDGTWGTKLPCFNTSDPGDATNRIRYRSFPDMSTGALGATNNPRKLAYYAWDQTSGTAGTTANPATGGTAFSSTFTRIQQFVEANEDRPTLQAPASSTTSVNTSITFGAGAFRLYSVDADPAFVGDPNLRYGLSIGQTNGTFRLGSQTGLTVTQFSNGDFIATGTVAELNAALVNSTFSPRPNYFGSANFSMALGLPTSPQRAVATIPITVDAFFAAASLGTISPSVPTTFVTGAFNSGATLSRYYRFTQSGDTRVVLSGAASFVDVFVYTRQGVLVGQSSTPSSLLKDVVLPSLVDGTYIVELRPNSSIAPFASTSFNLAVSADRNSDDLLVNAISLGPLRVTSRPTVRNSDTTGAANDRQTTTHLYCQS